jgi:dynein heavy chain
LALVLDVLGKIPASFDVEAAAAAYPVRHDQSMNTVLVQELIRYNRLLGVVRSTLKQLGDAVQGLVVMTSQLETAAASLQSGRVPSSWISAGYPSLKPLATWVADLVARIAFFSDWVAHGPPAAFWISGFFFTQSFLTGTLQNYARRCKLPIDTIDFEFEVLNSISGSDARAGSVTAPPQDGAYVYGLYLEGAAWDVDKGTLMEQAPQQLLCEMPAIWFKPQSSAAGGAGAAAAATPDHRYSCPVYRTALRRGTLSTTGHSTMWLINVKLPMPSHASEQHYIKRGAALLCQTSD